jgi:hypothetical protein
MRVANKIRVAHFKVFLLFCYIAYALLILGAVHPVTTPFKSGWEKWKHQAGLGFVAMYTEWTLTRFHTPYFSTNTKTYFRTSSDY